MSAKSFRIGHLDLSIDRSTFNSGTSALDRYFHRQVSQDIKRRVTACFAALDANDRVAGFYTLASASIFLDQLPEAAAKKLPKYREVPVVRMGRLAVDQDHKSKGLGSALLAHALERSAAVEIGAFAMIVDAKDESAARFYEHHGFMRLETPPLALFLPLATVKQLVK
ncbi:MAG: GNAT family N-acetyltransferase [Burkholderiaceae bacterium]|nr:GNAT family N-acetyltransferase [Burkholderiaceae bacterium]